MPPSASSNRPCRIDTAPVNAPFSWPNSSLSTSVGGSAAQLTRTSARLRAAAARVQRAGEQLLAGAGLAEQQHRRVHRRHLSQARERHPQRGAVADDVVEVVVGLDFFLQVVVVGGEPRVQPLDRRHAGAQCRLLPAALQRHAEDLGNQPHPFHHRIRPARRGSPRPDHQRTDDLLGHHHRHAQPGSPRRVHGVASGAGAPSSRESARPHAASADRPAIAAGSRLRRRSLPRSARCACAPMAPSVNSMSAQASDVDRPSRPAPAPRAIAGPISSTCSRANCDDNVAASRSNCCSSASRPSCPGPRR